MTAWADVVTGNLLSGISQIIGGPVPQSPNPAGTGTGTSAITNRDDLSDAQKAVLKYQGIDPDTASLEEINRSLGLPKPGPVPAGTPPPDINSPQNTDPRVNNPPPPTPPAGRDGTPPVTPVGDGKDDDTPLSGAAAEAAKRLDETLGQHRSAINDADEKLADAILNAQSSSEAGKTKLKQLQDSIITEIERIGPSLDTQAGQMQLAEFLRGKASEILNVANNAELDAQSHAALLDGVAAQLDAIGANDPKAGKEGEGNTPGQPDQPGGNQPATPPGEAATPGAPGDPGLPTNDPLLNGLASDPLMQGLGSLLGPGARTMRAPPPTPKPGARWPTNHAAPQSMRSTHANAGCRPKRTRTAPWPPSCAPPPPSSTR
ncbi:hypothetical protein MASS_1p0043 (plasmid) [Mycobacteroides abscessus subsp. bolletii 50594]|uniref:Biofilm regulator BssS n=1 Tax=Mycobacteroides abscessus subsp. bolletii 50594 TaxID=1303024 RepID=A0AB33AIQ9_9MYCO|nr:DUF4226 domain-containing protein [Mycobacteroides abscessus]AGM31603.1 hypothetical protein MASS_1p0043 [Mycobacteroides abscessus subsp. bolletii 50594]